MTSGVFVSSVSCFSKSYVSSILFLNLLWFETIVTSCVRIWFCLKLFKLLIVMESNGFNLLWLLEDILIVNLPYFNPLLFFFSYKSFSCLANTSLRLKSWKIWICFCCILLYKFFCLSSVSSCLVSIKVGLICLNLLP